MMSESDFSLKEMDLNTVYEMFPTQESCFKLLEQILWNNEPKCPYCDSKKYSILKVEKRYHCNSCNTSYRITVNSIFHNSKVELQKWFLAIHILLNENRKTSSRKLAVEINTSKDAAWYIITKIKKADPVKVDLFYKSLELRFEKHQQMTN